MAVETIPWTRRVSSWLTRPWQARLYRQAYDLARAAESWSADQVRDYHDVALRELVRYAGTRIPFYQKLYARHDVDVQRFRGLDQLHLLPIIHKSDVASRGREMTMPGVPAWRTFSVNTGGSSGVIATIWGYRGLTHRDGGQIGALWKRVGANYRDCFAILRGIIPRDARQPWQFDRSTNRLILSAYHINPASAGAYVDLMKRYRVQWLQAYPSAAWLLASVLESHGLTCDAGLRGVLLGSETVFEAQFERLRRVFHAPLYAHYGHRECVLLAGWCEQTTEYHFSPTYGYVEFRSPGEPGAAGLSGLAELIGTGYLNRYMPIIRYATDDFAVPAESGSCPECGRWHARAKVIYGRGQEFLVGRDQTVIPVVNINASAAYRHAARFQFKQDEPGRATYLFVPCNPAHVTQADEELQHSFAYLEPLGLHVDVRPVEDLPRTVLGKDRIVARSIPLPWERPGAS